VSAHPLVSRRALIVGVVLSVLCGLLIPYLDHYVQGTFVGGQHLPPGAVFALLVLVLVVNPALRLLSRKLPLTRAELLLIYAMLLVSTLVPGHGSESLFIPVSVSAFYYDTPARGWERIFLDYVPQWFHPRSQQAITSFYESLPPGSAIPWGQWVGPLLAWAVLVLALYGLATFLSLLLYPQWADHEKLTFPLVALPVEMTRNPDRPFVAGGFWGNPLMWVGFAGAALLGTGKGLGYYHPAFAGFRMEYPSLHTYFPDEPWRSIGWSPVIVYPLVAAISVLLRTEISGSLVFFYWLTKLELVFASAIGHRGGPHDIEGYPVWLGAQPWGGYFAYLGMALWSARPHLGHVWRQATGQEPPSAEAPVSARACLIGCGVCLVAAAGWLTVAGMSAWTAAVTAVCYAMIITILSKVVAESGLLFVQQTLMPGQVLNNLFGTSTIGVRNFTIGMYFEQAFGTDLRATVMPSFVQGLKIADEARLSQRWMVIAFWLAIAAALPVTYVRCLQVFYRYGGVNCDPWFATWSGLAGWNGLTRWLAAPRPASPLLAFWMAVGATALWGLSVLRRRYLWFPLHPIGFIMMQAHSMHPVWFSIFIGWVLKVVLLRYGGAKGLRNSFPFFLGIAFGDILMMMVWLIIASITGKHRLFLLPG
jgi:Family of unknown function (DUF6785)/Domain of unknown function (DUF6784)